MDAFRDDGMFVLNEKFGVFTFFFAHLRQFGNDRLPTIKELQLPPILKQLADEPRGLILVTGPTGSGKSTTLAAMIDLSLIHI